MIRTAAQLSLGPLIILAFAAYWLAYAIPAHGGERVCGNVSWYGVESGSRTYTGEKFDGTSLTMAMPSTRHIGERWRVFYRGRSVDLRVNDYGPRADLNRIADLSHEAARQLGLIAAGVDRVCMEKL